MNKTHTHLQSENGSPERSDFRAPIDPSLHHSTIPEDLNESVILYDDGDWSKGHYAGVFGLYAKAFIHNGLRVSVVCPKPELIQKQLGELADRCTFHRTTGKELKSKYRCFKPLTRMLWWARAGRMVRKIHRQETHLGPVFFMNINHLRRTLWTDRFSDWLMPCPWSAFTYDSSGVRGNPVDLKEQFHFLNAKYCTAFGVTDEKMVEPMQIAFPNIRIQFLPDTTLEEISSSPLTKQIPESSKGRKIVGLLGMLHKRKGLLDALKLAEKRTDLFFVFAGACDLNKMTVEEKTFAQSFFDAPPENCFVHLNRIDDEAEFNALVQQMDIIFAVYPDFTNSSGLLTKAGLFGKPVLVAEGDTCMADRVRKYNLGLAAPFGDIPAQSDTIDHLPTEEPPDYKAFRHEFNEAALQRALNQLLNPVSP